MGGGEGLSCPLGSYPALNYLVELGERSEPHTGVFNRDFV